MDVIQPIILCLVKHETNFTLGVLNTAHSKALSTPSPRSILPLLAEVSFPHRH